MTLLGTGEMGIGNTHGGGGAHGGAAPAPTPSDVVGRGTGLDDEGVAHKAEVVRTRPARQRKRR